MTPEYAGSRRRTLPVRRRRTFPVRRQEPDGEVGEKDVGFPTVSHSELTVRNPTSFPSTLPAGSRRQTGTVRRRESDGKLRENDVGFPTVSHMLEDKQPNCRTMLLGC